MNPNNAHKEGDYLVSEDQLGKTYKHPSYGMLSFSRTNGGHATLFGSSIQHSDTIVMTLREGEVTRGLNDDWFHGDNEIVQVEMSYSQFVETIASMNVGTGVPCTIKYIQGKGRIPEPDFINKREQITGELNQSMEVQIAKAQAAYDEIKELLETKKSIGKTDRQTILNALHSMSFGMENNAKFIFKQFQEQMDKTITESKGEIEAFAQNKINSIAQQALVQHRDDIIKLENPVDIKHLEIDVESGDDND